MTVPWSIAPLATKVYSRLVTLGAGGFLGTLAGFYSSLTLQSCLPCMWQFCLYLLALPAAHELTNVIPHDSCVLQSYVLFCERIPPDIFKARSPELLKVRCKLREDLHLSRFG